MNRLRELRERAGLKQEDIASLICVSPPNYCKKENGEIRVSLLEAKSLSDFYELPIEEIFFNLSFLKSSFIEG